MITVSLTSQRHIAAANAAWLATPDRQPTVTAYVQAANTLTSYTLVAGDYGNGYTATSASDQDYTCLSGALSGVWVRFIVGSAKAGSYLRITANTGQKIRLQAGVSASAGYVRSNVAGSWIKLYYNATDAEWVAVEQGGTWTIDS